MPSIFFGVQACAAFVSLQATSLAGAGSRSARYRRAVDRFEDRLEVPGKLEVVVFAAIIRENFEDHGKHGFSSVVGSAGIEATSLACRKRMPSCRSAGEYRPELPGEVCC
jgi:hypothetical protein